MSQIENTADGALGPDDPDAVDPELLVLPAPPTGRRSLVLVMMALVAVAAMALAFAVRHDVAYFFASSEVTDLGDVRELDPAALEGNTTVRVEGTPMLSRAVRYRKVLTGEEFVVFPLAGQRTVYVQVEDNARSVGRGEFAGRLATFNQLGGRFNTVEQELSNLHLPVSGESFLLVADRTPGGSAWAFFLALFCGLVVLIDLVLILRWFRPLPAPSGEMQSEPQS